MSEYSPQYPESQPSPYGGSETGTTDAGRPSPYTESASVDPAAYTPSGEAGTYSDSAYPVQYSEPVLTDAADASDSSVKDRAAESAQAGKQAASEVAQTATDKAKDVAAETKTQAQNVLGQAQSQLREQTKTQHQNLVTNLRSLGDELTSMANNSEQPGQASSLVGEAGSRVHGAASWLESREPSDLVGELRTLGQRRPAAFLLGALVAGVAAGRLTRGVVAVHHDDAPSDTSGGTSTYEPAAYGSAGYDGPASTGYETGYEAAGYQPIGSRHADPAQPPFGGIEP